MGSQASIYKYKDGISVCLFVSKKNKIRSNLFRDQPNQWFNEIKSVAFENLIYKDYYYEGELYVKLQKKA